MRREIGRPPLPAVELRAALLRPGGLWTELAVVAETGSTNADVAAAARAGAAEGLVVVAEHQTAGRGRAGRTWASPPRAGLMFSLLLRPGPAVPSSRWGWLPLLAGVALSEAVTGATGLATLLKWPNDLLVTGRKCAGILAEVVGSEEGSPITGPTVVGEPYSGKAGAAVVLGIGLNITQAAPELPPPNSGTLPATSLALAGARTTDRPALLHALLRTTQGWYERWRGAHGDADACKLRPAYLNRSATVGQQVRALLPDGTSLVGTAEAIDPDGCLVLRTRTGTRTLAAADVTHLRPPAPE